MHSLLRLYACDCSLDVTLVLIIFDMILIQYQLAGAPLGILGSHEKNVLVNNLVSLFFLYYNFIIIRGLSGPPSIMGP